MFLVAEQLSCFSTVPNATFLVFKLAMILSFMFPIS